MGFEIGTAELPAGRLTYHSGGAGKPVLYLHSAGGVTFTRPLEAIAEQYRVVAPVAPGFDGTAEIPSVATVRDYAALVAEFARTHVGERVDVIGSSFGSWVALWLAVTAPDLVDHLILQVPAGFRFGGKGGLPADAQARFKALHAHPDRIVGAAKPTAIQQANGAAYARYSGGLNDVDAALSARLAEIAAVTLILLGTEDQVVPPEAGAHLKRSIRQSQRVFVFDAAHSVEQDQPERITRLWRAFLSRGAGFVLNRGDEDDAAA